MKIIYNQTKGRRINKSYPRPLWIEPQDLNLVFDTTDKKWVFRADYSNGHGYTTTYYAMSYYKLKDVYSIKAAIRLINKWDVPKGTKFDVSLTWVGHSVVITKK